MQNKKFLYITSAVVGVFAICITCVPSVSFGFFGYGYDCGGKFGYGYTCDSNENDDSTDEKKNVVSGSKVRQYKTFKEKFKNHSAKIMYAKMKYLKKGSAEDVRRFEELRAVYKKYKNLSSDERRAHLTPKEYAEFQAYQHYTGYKKYRELKKDVGR